MATSVSWTLTLPTAAKSMKEVLIQWGKQVQYSLAIGALENRTELLSEKKRMGHTRVVCGVRESDKMDKKLHSEQSA